MNTSRLKYVCQQSCAKDSGWGKVVSRSMIAVISLNMRGQLLQQVRRGRRAFYGGSCLIDIYIESGVEEY